MAKLRAALLVLQCTMCLTIRVPVDWDSDGDVNNEPLPSTDKPVEAVQPNIPKEYFQYTAIKPQFAVDIAASHDVRSPDKLYTSYPVRPHTGVAKPTFGQHHLLDPQNEAYLPYQHFVNKSQSLKYVKPTSTSFEIFHPYKAEEPHLQELYKDPVLNKIRDDLRDSKNRLQKYENDAGEPHITSDEYLESPEQVDHRYQPHRNVPAKFEIHRPMRRPTYYRPPMKHIYRENIMDHKFKHPLNQNFVKVSPMHYRPVMNHLQHLRQQHALKFDDEQNEYPQLLPPESYAEKPDGYDIYEKGKANYIQLRNNLDESINKATLENRPLKNDKLELQKNEDYKVLTSNEEDEFVPIKNYAQVRKTETTKHLPRERAFLDADSYDEIKNAPRLREAIKSTKAQVVYSEEGYEDSAYDHAGEQKHASDHEEHGGHLAETERSKGKYKIPSVSTSHDDEKLSAYREQLLDGKKWKESKKNNEDDEDSVDYSEDEHSDSEETEIDSDGSSDEIIKKSDNYDENEDDLSSEDQTFKTRNKRQDVDKKAHSRDKSEFKVPEVNINLGLGKVKVNISSSTKFSSIPKDDIRLKYPYYFTEISGVNKDSPLRYAENLELIPKKSHGGVEFYESRSKIVCPEVEEEIDPVPDDLKKGENPGDKADKGAEFKKFNEKQRLKGLGDKIDCFKTKYFGNNPLDSPFFKEEIILSPKPIPVPKLNVFSSKFSSKKIAQVPIKDNLGLHSKHDDIFTILEGIYGKKKESGMFKDVSVPFSKQENEANNIKNSSQINKGSNIPSSSEIQSAAGDNPENIITILSRNRRANSFVYEPYKIIKESQTPDSKKTTTTSNISPLIKQLQSSRIIDRGSVKHNKGESLVRRNTNSKIYQDIDYENRQKYHNIDTNQSQYNEDKRRGEPRYDYELQNHKSYYTPVENKTAVTLEEYEEKTGNKVRPRKITSDAEFVTQSTHKNLRKNSSSSNIQQKVRDYIDSAASNTVKNILSTTTLQPRSKIRQRHSNIKNHKNNEKFEENDSHSNKDAKSRYVVTTEITTIKSKTQVPQMRYVPERIISTTDKSIEIDEADYIDETKDIQPDNKPKLELVTRFRNPSNITTDTVKKHNNNNESSIPKYREKKKKVTKSTLVTDTKTYGEDDDDDMRKEDVDAMIGVKHDMDDYIPSYEKKFSTGRGNNAEKEAGELDESEKHYENGDVRKEEDDSSNEDDEDDDVNENDDNDSEEEEEEDDDDDDDDDEEDFEDEDQENDHSDSQIKSDKRDKEQDDKKIYRSNTKTTETISTTTQSTITENKLSPKISRKKIEIHKELPVNKSSPHLSQFKQDIKEIEIIKEIPPKPRKKQQKNSEVLELYKDDNLAKDINKLGGVEIFREDLDLKSGPRHGGNYRSIDVQEKHDDETTAMLHPKQKSDVETSQTETKKHIDSSRRLPYGTRHITNRKANQQNENSKTQLTETIPGDISNTRRSVKNRRTKQPIDLKNAKLTESVEEINAHKPLHGGNLKLSGTNDRSQHNKNEKYIELNEDDEEEDTPRMHGGNFRSYGNSRNQMHGGNYRNAKIVEEVADVTEISNDNTKRGRKNVVKDEKNNAASMLSGFVRAVPILTTTPVYILDPSKRMYYYVDT